MSSSGVAQKGILANRVAVVTGSTDGIGLAIARRLAQDGAHVVVSSRKQQNVDRAVAMLQGEGLSVTGTVCHVGKAEDRERLVAKALEHSGSVDFLVCNAGVNPLVGSTLGASEKVWDKLWSKQQKQSTKRLTLCPLPPRIGQPEDCAGLVSFLCSSDASYISGENIAVAGFSSRL
ncbi:PREDICTED: dehydrogenase/reductase SDR family member 2, mitochondrial-like isoform X2 [Propithecus coquereli]|uniref:dehydrogenase/reductase SDR family member 2, mitochondrial-like isoform X2 n=1 Tax=Propithecus coquereli TaxID=379532 RepID=UPI00063F6128|nr:PREDICTED: dehydrogenase/reductase SDR family member 2, mitochondrial-like isoform X2 [Propithecus coquereli]